MKSLHISLILIILIAIKLIKCNIDLKACLHACQYITNQQIYDQCINACVIATTTNEAPNKQFQNHYYSPPQQTVSTNPVQTEYILGFVVILVIFGFMWYNQNQKNFQNDLDKQKIQNELQTQERINQVRHDTNQQDKRRNEADIHDNRTDIRTLAVGLNGLQALTGQLGVDHDTLRLEYSRGTEIQNEFNRGITENLATQTSNLNNLKVEFNHNRDQFHDFRSRQLGFNQVISNQVHDNQANIQALHRRVKRNNSLKEILGFIAPLTTPILSGVGRRAAGAITSKNHGSHSQRFNLYKT